MQYQDLKIKKTTPPPRTRSVSDEMTSPLINQQFILVATIMKVPGDGSVKKTFLQFHHCIEPRRVLNKIEKVFRMSVYIYTEQFRCLRFGLNT